MRRLWVTALVGGMVLAGCGGGGGGGPVAGQLRVVVQTAPANAAAIMFDIAGGEVTSSAAGSGLTLYSARIGAVTRIIVAGPLAGGSEILRFNVPDVSTIYSLTVQQVATNPSFSLLDAGTVGLAVQK